MNRKGFTLVELLAALVILGILVSIGGVAITSTINGSKKKNYETLVSNIKSGVEAYYQECKYGRVDGKDYSYCMQNNDDELYKVNVSVLLKYGYISSNGDNKLINPKNEKSQICQVGYIYVSDTYKIELADEVVNNKLLGDGIFEAPIDNTNC